MDKNLSKKLQDKALSTQKNAHVPYSDFKVGAAVLSDSNTMYSGCNVENAAYPLGQCAEATAIGNMVAAGDKRLAAVTIASPDDNFCYPCGGCRQKIAEFADDEVVVTLVNQRGETKQHTIGELLPYAFRFTKPAKQ